MRYHSLESQPNFTQAAQPELALVALISLRNYSNVDRVRKAARVVRRSGHLQHTATHRSRLFIGALWRCLYYISRMATLCGGSAADPDPGSEDADDDDVFLFGDAPPLRADTAWRADKFLIVSSSRVWVRSRSCARHVGAALLRTSRIRVLRLRHFSAASDLKQADLNGGAPAGSEESTPPDTSPPSCSSPCGALPAPIAAATLSAGAGGSVPMVPPPWTAAAAALVDRSAGSTL